MERASKKFIIFGILLITLSLFLIPFIVLFTFLNISNTLKIIFYSSLIVLIILSFSFGISLLIIGIQRYKKSFLILVKSVKREDKESELKKISKKIIILPVEIGIRAITILNLSSLVYLESENRDCEKRFNEMKKFLHGTFPPYTSEDLDISDWLEGNEEIMFDYKTLNNENYIPEFFKASLQITNKIFHGEPLSDYEEINELFTTFTIGKEKYNLENDFFKIIGGIEEELKKIVPKTTQRTDIILTKNNTLLSELFSELPEKDRISKESFKHTKEEKRILDNILERIKGTFENFSEKFEKIQSKTDLTAEKKEEIEKETLNVVINLKNEIRRNYRLFKELEEKGEKIKKRIFISKTYFSKSLERIRKEIIEIMNDPDNQEENIKRINNVIEKLLEFEIKSDALKKIVKNIFKWIDKKLIFLREYSEEPFIKAVKYSKNEEIFFNVFEKTKNLEINELEIEKYIRELQIPEEEKKNLFFVLSTIKGIFFESNEKVYGLIVKEVSPDEKLKNAIKEETEENINKFLAEFPEFSELRVFKDIKTFFTKTPDLLNLEVKAEELKENINEILKEIEGNKYFYFLVLFYIVALLVYIKSKGKKIVKSFEEEEDYKQVQKIEIAEIEAVGRVKEGNRIFLEELRNLRGNSEEINIVEDLKELSKIVDNNVQKIIDTVYDILTKIKETIEEKNPLFNLVSIQLTVEAFFSKKTTNFEGGKTEDILDMLSLYFIHQNMYELIKEARKMDNIMLRNKKERFYEGMLKKYPFLLDILNEIFLVPSRQKIVIEEGILTIYDIKEIKRPSFIQETKRKNLENFLGELKNKKTFRFRKLLDIYRMIKNKEEKRKAREIISTIERAMKRIYENVEKFQVDPAKNETLKKLEKLRISIHEQIKIIEKGSFSPFFSSIPLDFYSVFLQCRELIIKNNFDSFDPGELFQKIHQDIRYIASKLLTKILQTKNLKIVYNDADKKYTKVNSDTIGPVSEETDFGYLFEPYYRNEDDFYDDLSVNEQITFTLIEKVDKIFQNNQVINEIKGFKDKMKQDITEYMNNQKTLDDLKNSYRTIHNDLTDNIKNHTQKLNKIQFIEALEEKITNVFNEAEKIVKNIQGDIDEKEIITKIKEFQNNFNDYYYIDYSKDIFNKILEQKQRKIRRENGDISIGNISDIENILSKRVGDLRDLKQKLQDVQQAQQIQDPTSIINKIENFIEIINKNIEDLQTKPQIDADVLNTLFNTIKQPYDNEQLQKYFLSKNIFENIEKAITYMKEDLSKKPEEINFNTLRRYIQPYRDIVIKDPLKKIINKLLSVKKTQ